MAPDQRGEVAGEVGLIYTIDTLLRGRPTGQLGGHFLVVEKSREINGLKLPDNLGQLETIRQQMASPGADWRGLILRVCI